MLTYRRRLQTQISLGEPPREFRDRAMRLATETMAEDPVQSPEATVTPMATPWPS